MLDLHGNGEPGTLAVEEIPQSVTLAWQAPSSMWPPHEVDCAKALVPHLSKPEGISQGKPTLSICVVHLNSLACTDSSAQTGVMFQDGQRHRKDL